MAFSCVEARQNIWNVILAKDEMFMRRGESWRPYHTTHYTV